MAAARLQMGRSAPMARPVVVPRGDEADYRAQVLRVQDVPEAEEDSPAADAEHVVESADIGLHTADLARFVLGKDAEAVSLRKQCADCEGRKLSAFTVAEIRVLVLYATWRVKSACYGARSVSEMREIIGSKLARNPAPEVKCAEGHGASARWWCKFAS